MLKLVWREGARRDIIAAIAYIAEHDSAAAERLHTAIEAFANRLQDYPHIGRPGRAPGQREAVVHPNYILIYRVTGEAVEIVRLVHSRQQYP